MAHIFFSFWLKNIFGGAEFQIHFLLRSLILDATEKVFVFFQLMIPIWMVLHSKIGDR